MKTLYISDLDGTLLTKEERISEYSIGLINEMISDGLPFTYATARSINTALKATAGLHNDLPAIFYNGALIANPVTGEILGCEAFDRSQTEYLISAIERYGVPPLVYARQNGKERVSFLVGKENEGMKRYLSRREGDPRLNPVSDKEELFQGDIFYLTFIADKTKLDAFYDEAKRGAHFSVIYTQETYQEDYWLEIMPSGATKASAALRLKSMLGFDRLVCFGDGVNDLAMFDVADEKYAVMNAHDDLKKKATDVIGYCEEDGVAKWLAAHGCSVRRVE